MSMEPRILPTVGPLHPWLHTIHLAFVPGPMTPLLKEMTANLLDRFRHLGHKVQTTPDDHTDVLLTTALFGQVVNWRESLLLTGRRRFRLRRTPMVYTLLATTPAELAQALARLDAALSREEPDPADFDFAGLAPDAYRTLYRQGQRGGSILPRNGSHHRRAHQSQLLITALHERSKQR